ncbi:hypothetical protein AGLY_009552 [Aphis glycines]|uniref:Uncharacterized protein n=1 Tax=Aphis glycines TaxID=307491 RepID=A0A6G0TJY6_APHGL|nr:hypothetical protein AGLY_009552 [Aphis glycines]
MVGRGLFGVFANKYPGVWFEESVVMVELQDLFKTLEIFMNPKCSLNDLIILHFSARCSVPQFLIHIARRSSSGFGYWKKLISPRVLASLLQYGTEQRISFRNIKKQTIMCKDYAEILIAYWHQDFDITAKIKAIDIHIVVIPSQHHATEPYKIIRYNYLHSRNCQLKIHIDLKIKFFKNKKHSLYLYLIGQANIINYLCTKKK